MTIERFTLGQVVKYPYKWAHSSDFEEPKERPACLMLKIQTPGGGTKLALVAISDMPSKGAGMSIEVPPEEIARAGLSHYRSAHVHLGEVNFDKLGNSFSFNPRARILGRFSKPFLSRIGRQLIANIKSGRVIKITRD